ncbi:MAG: hypothetical protein PHD73_12430 [Sediminibacterium sp.]|nr:hypothetical protein [Sediminibacterium sp.]
MKKHIPILLTLLCFFSMGANAQSKSDNADNPDGNRLDFSIGFANPIAQQTFAQFYKTKGLQPRVTVEYGLLNLPYTKGLNARISAIAGLEPQSFNNTTTYTSMVKMTQKPIGGRFYPLVLRNGLESVKHNTDGLLSWEIFKYGALWLLKGFYLEGGVSPSVKMTEEGYADVTRSPTFFGWGVSVYDLNEDSRLRFKFNFGTRKYTWTNASSTTSQIKSFCMDFGLSYKL